MINYSTHSSNIQMSNFPLNFTSSRIWSQTTHILEYIWFVLLTSIWWCWSWVIVAAATAMSMIATWTEGSNSSNWAGWGVTNQSKNTDKYLRAHRIQKYYYHNRFDIFSPNRFTNKSLDLKQMTDFEKRKIMFNWIYCLHQITHAPSFWWWCCLFCKWQSTDDLINATSIFYTKWKSHRIHKILYNLKILNKILFASQMHISKSQRNEEEKLDQLYPKT